MFDEKLDFLLHLGDNALILGQQLTQWLGKGPALEEDMALANIALDLIGQARLWLSYAGEVEGTERDEDQLAFLRDAHDFRNLLLVEQPNGNYADTLVRQFYFDTWHYFLLERLTASTDERIAAIAAKAWKEVAYHLRRSGDLIVRIGDGTPESRRKTQAAADSLWMFTGEMFDGDLFLVAGTGIGMQPDLHAKWLAQVGDTFAAATLTMPSPESWMQKGGNRGRHGEKLGYILAEMQFLQRAYPGARW